MSFTNYTEGIVLDELFGGNDFIPPTTLYIGLSTTAPTEDGTGISEPSGGGYERASVTNNATNFPPTGVDGTKTNGTTISFPQASADWGTVTHFFIADAPTGGNILVYGTLGVAKTVGTLDTVSIGADSLVITLN